MNWGAALRHNVGRGVRAERELGRRRKAHEWEVAKANKDALLVQLTGFEKMAADLDRARSLRRLMGEIAASKAAPSELVGNFKPDGVEGGLAGPSRKGPWPVVDVISDQSPNGGR